MLANPNIRKMLILALSIYLIAIGYRTATAVGFSYDADKTVVGSVRHHTVTPKETLLDIARDFGLGFNEIRLLYPAMDPWIPEPGSRLAIPTRWILPPTRHHGLVINLPELRLYHFLPKFGIVTTYPVGIGDIGRETPVAVGRVIHRQVDPTWVIPESLRDKYGIVSVHPGPHNPLGKYWVGLSLDGYGIHGTNFPWGVGRLVSHGCIRLYPEHIALLFEEVCVGEPFEIVYEPVKIGIQAGNMFIEVHPDIYGRIPDMEAHTKRQLQEMGLWGSISVRAVKDALQKQNGVPVHIGCLKKGGDASITVGASDF